MIRRLGSHTGRKIVFGYDRYLSDELDSYLAVLASHGEVSLAVDSDSLHYLSSAQRVCERVRGRADAVGVLLCSTGMGMSIAANKFSGIYAARCVSVDDATMARSINNCNVVCLALRSTLELNARIIEAFMTTAYEGRKLEQLSRITLLENDMAPIETPRVRPHVKSV